MQKSLGFTLIELLVVVLIIGILAAVALPQYEKAVEKSRSVEALTNLRSIVQAMQLFKMANGEPARALDDLDITLTGTKINDRTIELKNFTYDIRNFRPETSEGFEAVATRNDQDSDIKKYYIYFSYVGGMHCVAKTKAAEVPCAVVCGHAQFKPHSPSSYTICSIN